MRGDGAEPVPVVKMRRRKGMSAAAREAVSLAQKKRWADWRAKQAKAAQGDGASAQRPSPGRSRKKK
jgi:hypothetical protein